CRYESSAPFDACHSLSSLLFPIFPYQFHHQHQWFLSSSYSVQSHYIRMVEITHESSLSHDILDLLFSHHIQFGQFDGHIYLLSSLLQFECSFVHFSKCSFSQFLRRFNVHVIQLPASTSRRSTDQTFVALRFTVHSEIKDQSNRA
ncbi:hypothetical protein PMAYCL1PPCAC_24218, partial [Pristionchus mayeri]